MQEARWGRFLNSNLDDFLNSFFFFLFLRVVFWKTAAA
jgi:hypothetical protein